MPEPKPAPDCPCARLRQRVAFNILLDECAIAVLSDAVAALRRADDPSIADLERAIRTHRIGILKQRAILGAFGFGV